MSDAIKSRIRQRLAELERKGVKARTASVKSGMSADAIRSILRKTNSSPTVETLTKLAEPLETTPEWLAFGVGDEIPVVQARAGELVSRSLPVIGEVAAGRWLEAEEHVDEPLYDPVPVQPDPRWPFEEQFGLVVRGNSLNRVAIDGDILACVNLTAVGREPTPDEIVIVEMRRFAGFLRQRTAKRFVPTETHLELWPDSDDPRWQNPIIVPKGKSAREFVYDDDEGRIDVGVTALVTWVHRPIQRRRRS